MCSSADAHDSQSFALDSQAHLRPSHIAPAQLLVQRRHRPGARPHPLSPVRSLASWGPNLGTQPAGLIMGQESALTAALTGIVVQVRP